MLNRIKKLLVLLIAGVTISVFSLSNVRAQGSAELYLYYIMEYTYQILGKVNNLPSYLNTLSRLAISWLAPDDSKSTAQIQANFASLGNLFVQGSANNYIGRLNPDLFKQPASSFTLPADNPAILRLLPQGYLNINDITYSTLLGQPPVPKTVTLDSPYNYVKNAAGMNIVHQMPVLNWQGDKADKDVYLNYYATIMSVESFNGYVLSSQLSELNTFTTLQNALISQASNSSWISEISTEALGKVLRQLLMFESQTYVLITELLQTQKQLLTAQVMTNSLLILNNQVNESYLVSKAQGVQPQP